MQSIYLPCAAAPNPGVTLSGINGLVYDNSVIYYAGDILSICRCDIDLDGSGTMCGVVAAGQPAVCGMHM